MLTVAHIITKLELGGAQQNTLFTVAQLDRKRFRPVLITGEAGYLDAEAQAIPALELHQVPSLRRTIHPIDDCRAAHELTAILRRLRPDIVHTHSSKAGILGRWAAHRAGVPVIVHTIHGFGITPEQPILLRTLLLAAERRVSRYTSRFFAVSEANRRQGMQWRLFSPERCSVIRSGIDLAAYRARALNRREARQRLAWPPDRPMVGMIAPLKPQKAPVDFVRVAAEVHRHHPDAQFVLVGDGHLRPTVEAEIARLGLGDACRLLGWRRDVPDILGALNVLMLTSRWEGLPRVYLEALASGVPVVGTAVDGAAEVIHDGENGYLCAPGNVAGLAQRLCDLLDNPGLGKSMGERGRVLPSEFDIHEMVRRLEQQYLDLAGDGAASTMSAAPTLETAMRCR
jgi:glycosyltransferase involved in cell wall biosynthesis